MSTDPKPLGSTYRIQLNGFGLRATAGLVGYLHELGIETIYLSPIATAAPGSDHGYDVVDPTKLDPALGTPEDLEALFEAVDSLQMRVLLDIVPNHMSTSPENVWWTDVLRRGQQSEFARFFDIDWEAGGGRVVLPVLGSPFGDVLERGDLKVRTGPSGDLYVWYGDRPFPLSEKSAVSAGLFDLQPGSLRDLLDVQYYRLAHWRVAPYEVNYRRFFDINDLVGIRVEDPEVYRATHQLTIALAGDPRVAGVRVDHIDGLAEPEDYLLRLRQDLTPQRTLLVEKVLARGEEIPESWAIDGTTGYEFADVAIAVLTDDKGSRSIADHISGGPCDFHHQAESGRREAMQRLFPGQLDRLAVEVAQVAGTTLGGRDIPTAAFRQALCELTACLSVYRTYSTPGDTSASDTERIDTAAAKARKHLKDGLSLRALSVLSKLLLGYPLDQAEPAPPRELWTRLCIRWQQLCSAVAAKGVEDTALYRFGGLLSAADVGSDPGEPAITIAEFHQSMGRRVSSIPRSLNTTSTHDSKRSEDSRCRLATLSEVPGRWFALLGTLRDLNKAIADHSFGAEGVPSEIESSLYQAIFAIWPATGGWGDALTERVVAYCLKAAREAKVYTSWSRPDDSFEGGITEFAHEILASAETSDAFQELVDEMGTAGAANSLALVVMKTTAPGVPDFYQGTETWRYQLVDPDNRRPVDFEALKRTLSALDTASAKQLAHHWRDGSLKTFVIRSALRARRRFPQLFAEGSYIPVEVRGTHRERIVSFVRQLGDQCALVVVPRFIMGIAGPGEFPLADDWQDTELLLPEGLAGLADVLSEKVIDAGPTILVADILETFPVALLVSA